MDKFDVTPAPGLLKRLGDIDYAVWQCLAELVDNSVDAFAAAVEKGSGLMYPEVHVSLPSKDVLTKDPEAFVEVRDNGVGMPADTLERAVRAGYSGNDPIGKLGLFGMGFNVATARLGGCTEVWSCQRDDETWVGLQIDYDTIGRMGTFKVPRLARPRRATDVKSGTVVRITKLKKELLEKAVSSRALATLRQKLSTTYGHIIRKLGLKLYVNDVLIEAYRFCTWSEARSVTHQGIGEVPAVILLSRDFGSLPYCAACWAWLEEGSGFCAMCNSDKSIRSRTRRLSGWIGIQRYFDKDDYGLDLIRNGRVIESRNKSLFSWTNPADGSIVPEYPIDGVVGGRIVGELEIDFVPVGYRKDAFEKDSKEWKLVYEFVHGTGPVLPEVASRLGHEVPSSPFYRLHAAYRRVIPGLRYLIPGGLDGGVDNVSASNWAAFFHEGKAEYQDDTKWYEAAKFAEELKTPKTTAAGGKVGAASGGGTGLGALPLMGGAPSVPPAEPSTAEAGVRDPKLSRKFELTIAGQHVELTVRALTSQVALEIDARARVSPKNKNLEFRYFSDHPDYMSGAASPRDDLVAELSHQLRERAGEAAAGVSLGVVADRLRDAYFPDSRLTVAAVRARATGILERTKSKLVDWLASQPNNKSSVSDAERALIAKRVLAVEHGGPDRVEEVINNGTFPQYLPLTMVPVLALRFPAAILDKKLFSFPHAGLAAALQEESTAELSRALADAAWAVEDKAGTLQPVELSSRLSRASASLNLLEQWSSA